MQLTQLQAEVARRADQLFPNVVAGVFFTAKKTHVSRSGRAGGQSGCDCDVCVTQNAYIRAKIRAKIRARRWDCSESSIDVAALRAYKNRVLEQSAMASSS